jgi:hypothetical protein
MGRDAMMGRNSAKVGLQIIQYFISQLKTSFCARQKKINTCINTCGKCKPSPTHSKFPGGVQIHPISVGDGKKHKALDPKLTILHTVMVTLTYFNLNSTYNPELIQRPSLFEMLGLLNISRMCALFIMSNWSSPEKKTINFHFCSSKQNLTKFGYLAKWRRYSAKLGCLVFTVRYKDCIKTTQEQIDSKV